MNIRLIITGILLFAIATAILYGWGMRRQMNKSRDLMNLLFANGVSKVNKYMKKHPSVNEKEVQEMMTGMTARLPFSTDKSVVTEPKEFTRQLLEYMVKTGQLRKNGDVYEK